MNLQAPDPGGVKSSMEMPLLSARSLSGVMLLSTASHAGPLASAWLPEALAARASAGGPCAACSSLVAALFRESRFNLQDSGFTIRFSPEGDGEPASPFPSASLARPLRPPEAFLVSFLLLRPRPPAPLFFSVRWKMEGTAVGLSRRCWSSSLLEKLSLVKCSLQRKEYLVGVQLSL